MTGTQNLFAILDDSDSSISRIPLTGALQKEIPLLFNEQKQSFVYNKQERDFCGSYKVDSDELFIIKNYPIDIAISEAIQNPLVLPILDLTNQVSLKAIFTGSWDDNKLIYFQVTDAAKLLKQKVTLINANSTFTKLTEPGIILPNKLSAIYDNGKLLFQSYHNTKRFLDLLSYFREATDAEIDVFLAHDLFDFEDKESFKDNADSIVRKKIALLLTNNILEKITIPELESVAGELNSVVNEENKINLRISGCKLIIPKDKKDLKELIRFLDEDYFTTPFTKRKCLTNSKTFLQ